MAAMICSNEPSADKGAQADRAADHDLQAGNWLMLPGTLRLSYLRPHTRLHPPLNLCQPHLHIACWQHGLVKRHLRGGTECSSQQAGVLTLLSQCVGSLPLTLSFSAEFMAVMVASGSKSRLAMASKHFLRCGCTAHGFLVWLRICSSSSLDRKKNLQQAAGPRSCVSVACMCVADAHPSPTPPPQPNRQCPRHHCVRWLTGPHLANARRLVSR